jgi:hypothetical protein
MPGNIPAGPAPAAPAPASSAPGEAGGPVVPVLLAVAGLALAGRAARPALPGARCRSAGGDLIRRETQPPLKGATRGFMPEYSPAGFGYQIQKCIVYRSGCQKKNAAPVPGAVVGQSAWLGSGTNVPSA